mgnify:CR=1 FL=1
MASIRKRGAYQWEVKIRKKGYPTQSKTFTRKMDAEDWARDIESEMSRSAFLSRKEAEGTTLEEAIDRFLEEFADNYAQSRHIKSKANIVKKGEIAEMTLASIRGKDIAAYIKDREDEGRASQTILQRSKLDLPRLRNLPQRLGHGIPSKPHQTR